MALQKQPVSITFNQGVQTKVDPFQLPIGAFSSLTNAVFTKDGLLQKRNGYDLLVNAPTGATTLCTLNKGLVLLGQTLQSYSEDNNSLVNVGQFQPLSIDVQPINRNTSTAPLTLDASVAANGLVCTTMFFGVAGTYQISDSDTGQVIVAPTMFGTAATFARIEVVGNYFVIIYLDTISTVDQLMYITIPLSDPTNPSTPVSITTHVTAGEACFDTFSFNNSLYISVIESGSCRVFNIPQLNLLSTSIPTPATISNAAFSTYKNPVIYVEPNNGFPLIWTAIFEPLDNNLYAFCLNNDLTTNLGVTTVLTGSVGIDHLAVAAANNTLSLFYSLHNFLPNINIQSNYINTKTIQLNGTVSTASTIIRGVDLISKALFSPELNKTVVLVSYGLTATSGTQETNEATNFLIDTTGKALARIAQSNAGGYFTSYNILPKLQELDSSIYAFYLFADQVQAANKTQGASQNGIWAQYGPNLAKLTFSLPTQGLEIADNLHPSGGYLWEYDGAVIVEHGFHLYPENLFVVGAAASGHITPAQSPLFYVATYEWTDNTGKIHRSAPSIPLEFIIKTPVVSFTGTTHGNKSITGISTSDTATMQIGQLVTGTLIPSNTYITGVGSTSITISNNAGNSTTQTMGLVAVQAVKIQVPTLRVTAKVGARIVIYRWSETQQTYYQVTSITSPIGNDPTSDTITFTDTFSDDEIIGNNILYTNGGVIENIAAPGSNAMTLWQSRLFMVDAENRNLIWFSKPVIEATPVEMSDVFTIYIAPTTGAQGSTGDITALFSMDDKLIVFKKDAMYYITGQGPDITGANNSFSDPIFITGTVGCDNPRSLVLTPMGVMFQSDKGIWLLGRDLQTTYIGAAVESFTQGQIVTSALCIPGTNQIRFTLDNLIGVMYDYFFQRWSNWDNINATSAVIYNGVQAYLNTYNQVVLETPGIYKDLSHRVLWSLTTGWINLAGLQGFERFYQLFLLGQYLEPFKLQVQLAYDYNSSPSQSIIVTPEQTQSSWGSEAQWGTGGPWGEGSSAFEARVFPITQKCEAFQLTVSELYAEGGSNSTGAGLTLSGVNLIVGTKRGFRTQAANRSFGK